jgi:hypothetical protein
MLSLKVPPNAVQFFSKIWKMPTRLCSFLESCFKLAARYPRLTQGGYWSGIYQSLFQKLIVLCIVAM